MPRFIHYPSYRDTGLPWLGQIPAHWDIMRLKQVSKHSALYGANEPSDNYLDEGVRFLRTTDIDEIGNLNPENAVYIELDKVRDYILDDGDLLVSRSGTIGRSFVYSKDIHGICAYAGYLVRFVLNQEILFPKFAFYFTKTKHFSDWLGVSVIQSTIGNVNGQKYANMHLPVPTLLEQQAIAAFLDHHTAKIDALIAKNQRLLSTLAEQHTAIISQVVTKGLNPKEKMKDSGLAWLGQIPKHWEVMQLKYAVDLNAETLPEKTDPDYVIKYLDISNVDELEGTGEVREICFENAPSRARRIVRAGDTIISTVRTYLKAIAYFENPPENQIVSTGFAVLHPRPAVYPIYLSWVIQSKPFVEKVVAHSVGVGYPAINPSELASLKIWLPTIPEQREIVDFLDAQTLQLADLSAKVENAIERLQEYRSALISSVVTGKIDVRGVN